MEGLFFAVDPLWWDIPIRVSSVIFSLLAGLGVYIWFSVQRKPLSLIPKAPFVYHPVNITDDQFAEKTLVQIRGWVSHVYAPYHGWAHLPAEIQSYCRNPELLDIIDALEKSEYTNATIDRAQAESIHQKLKKLLITHDTV